MRGICQINVFEVSPQLVKLLELLTQYDKPGKELKKYRICKNDKNFKSINIGRDYAIIAKKCLVSHRFHAAATMLDIICQEMNMDDVFFYKASSIVLENIPTTTDDNFFYFIRHVVTLKCINKREVALEYLIYALRNQNLDGQHNAKVLISSQKKHILKNFIIDPLMKGYAAMFDYLEWAKCHQRGLHDMYAITSAEKTIETFKEILEVPGQWDIFVLKLIEMLEFFDRTEEIEILLKKYVELNPEHLNSHIYLIWYLNKYNPASNELINCLKKLVKVCPSDSRVLLLAKHFKNKCPERSLKILFMFLDYPSNLKNAEAWELLLELLRGILENQKPSLMKVMNNLWKSRRDIWYYTHFNGKFFTISDEEEAKLVIEVGTVLSVFVKSHSFINYVLNSFPVLSDKLRKDFVNQVSHIQNLKETTSSEDTSDDMDVT